MQLGTRSEILLSDSGLGICLMGFSFTKTKQSVEGVTKMEEQISRDCNILSCENSTGT